MSPPTIGLSIIDMTIERANNRQVPLRAPDAGLILAAWTGVGCGVFEISARPANAAAFRVAFGVLLVLSIATSTRFRPSTTILAPAAARSPVTSGV